MTAPGCSGGRPGPGPGPANGSREGAASGSGAGATIAGKGTDAGAAPSVGETPAMSWLMLSGTGGRLVSAGKLLSAATAAAVELETASIVPLRTAQAQLVQSPVHPGTVLGDVPGFTPASQWDATAWMVALCFTLSAVNGCYLPVSTMSLTSLPACKSIDALGATRQKRVAGAPRTLQQPASVATSDPPVPAAPCVQSCTGDWLPGLCTVLAS